MAGNFPAYDGPGPCGQPNQTNLAKFIIHKAKRAVKKDIVTG